jgi:LysM repeat protein
MHKVTNQTIEEWLNSAVGVGMDPDGAYGYQCVDLVDQYGQDIFGVRWPVCVGGVGGANQLLDVVPDEYWIRIDNNFSDPNQVPERGDVVVFGGDSSNPYGHTAVILNADTNGIHVVQQNGNANWLPAGLADLEYTQFGTGSVIGWLRAREDKLLPPEHPAPKVTVRQCIVDPGDTLGGIADQFDISLDQIIAANPGINPDLIHPGQVLNLA